MKTNERNLSESLDSLHIDPKQLKACEILKETLQFSKKKVVEGATPKKIDQSLASFIKRRGGTPYCKGYEVNGYKYPANTCISINDTIAHGIPDTEPLQAGDVVSIDVVVDFEGMKADAARTFIVGENQEGTELIRIATESLLKGAERAKPGIRLYDVVKAVYTTVRSFNAETYFGLYGHFIGTELHMNPFIPQRHIARNEQEEGWLNYVLQEGDILCLEPFVTYGNPNPFLASDHWSINSTDGAISAHIENTYIITKEGAVSLTGDLTLP